MKKILIQVAVILALSSCSKKDDIVIPKQPLVKDTVAWVDLPGSTLSSKTDYRPLKWQYFHDEKGFCIKLWAGATKGYGITKDSVIGGGEIYRLNEKGLVDTFRQVNRKDYIVVFLYDENNKCVRQKTIMTNGSGESIIDNVWDQAGNLVNAGGAKYEYYTDILNTTAKTGEKWMYGLASKNAVKVKTDAGNQNRSVHEYKLDAQKRIIEEKVVYQYYVVADRRWNTSPGSQITTFEYK